MDESWKQFYELEEHIREHNSQIEQLSPKKTHSRQSSGELKIKREGTRYFQERILQLTKEVKDKEREIMYLQRNVSTLESYKEQCQNLQKQIKLMREKLSHYETEASEKVMAFLSIQNDVVPEWERCKQDLEKLQEENLKLNKNLEQVNHQLQEKSESFSRLKQDYTALEKTFHSIEEDKRNLKLKLNETNEKLKVSEQQNQKYTQTIKEKEQLNSAFEEDNERLREQLEKALDSLQKCQNEISSIPNFQQEIKHYEKLITSASKETEKEKTKRLRYQEESNALKKQLNQIYDLTQQEDPYEFIKSLLRKFNETRSK